MLIENFVIIVYSGHVGERPETSDFIRLLQDDFRGDRGQRQSQVRNGHLVAYRTIVEMRGLLGFPVAHASKITFDFGSFGVSFPKEPALSGDFGANVFRNDVCGTTITRSGAETFMVCRAGIRQGSFFLSRRRFDRATELLSLPAVFR